MVLMTWGEISKALEILRGDLVGKARKGLPDEVFRFVSSVTPLVNVDLLIRDESGRILLTWRDDEFYGPGWHVPGGIIRFKETAAERIKAVASLELGAEVSYGTSPLGVYEMFNDTRDVRGHFVSLLYECRLKTCLNETRRYQPACPAGGAWWWHEYFPADMITPHQIYAGWFCGSSRDEDNLL